MGLRATVFAACFALTLSAAPKLRLNETTVGPVSVAVGGDGPNRTVEAYNAGDGTLDLTASSSAQWVSATVGARRACSMSDGECIPLQFRLATSSLAKGSYTGVVTVSDPGALDAPQTITVTVQVGGGVPDKVEMWVPPGGTAQTRFHTNSLVWPEVQANGGQWLSLALEGVGSFRFVYPWRVQAIHRPDMAEGDYSGSITINGSALPADNKSVPVALHVTSGPIIEISPSALRLRLGHGAAPFKSLLEFFNRGAGSLDFAGASAATASGGNWLAADRTDPARVTVTADAAVLAPGMYEGSVKVESNAANGALTIPVSLEIVPRAPPAISFGGVTTAGPPSPDDTIAPGSLVVLTGEQFSFDAPVTASPPLPSELGRVRVLLNDQPVALSLVSHSRIDFQAPFEAALGEGVLRVERDGERGNAVAVRVLPQAPRILALGATEYGQVKNADGSFAAPAGVAAAPDSSRPARIGDTIRILAYGLGQTAPAVPAGAEAPADPLAQAVSVPYVVFGGSALIPGVSVQAQSASLVPGSVGLYQIAVQLADGIPAGPSINMHLDTGNGIGSNRVRVAIE